MGLKSLLTPRAPQAHGRTVQAVFPTMQSAERFALGLRTGRAFVPGSRNLLTIGDAAAMNGGRMVRSLLGRELSVYGNQPYISNIDREYLATRNPTAKMMVTRPARESWFASPRTFTEKGDDFMRTLRRLSFGARSATAADAHSATYGGGLVYLRAGGNPDTPLRKGDRWFGFDWIPIGSVVGDTVTWDETGDETLLQHGIEFVDVRTRDDSTVSPKTIHGSRLISMCEDPAERTCSAESILDAAFDPLWTFTDHLWAGRLSSVEGNPVVAEVDLDHPEAVDITTEDQKKDHEKSLRAMFAAWRGGHNQSLGARGIKFTRLGKGELNDRSVDVAMLASQIAHASKWFTVEQILGSTTGSKKEDMTTLEAHEGLMHIRSEGYCHPIYQHLWTLGQVSGLVPRRSEMPLDLEWPRLRRMDERQQAIADRSDAMTLQVALKSGRLPPARILERFPSNPDGILPAQPRVGQPAQNPSGSADGDAETAAEHEALEALEREDNA